MSDNNTNDQIRARIDAFLKDIGGLVNQVALGAVQDALSGRSPAETRKTRAPRPVRRGRPKNAAAKPARRSGGRIRRSTEAVEKMAERFHHYVKAHPGQGIEQISKGLSIASKELKLPVVKLLAIKRMRTEGQKRGTRYFVGGKKRAARKPARRPARKERRVVRRPRNVAKKAIRRKASAPKKVAKRTRRVMKRAPRKVAQKVIAPKVSAPKLSPAAKKPTAAPETSSIASTLAERVAVHG